MVGYPGMHNIGRPKTEESQKAKFRSHTFYFPLRMDDIWNEFNKVCKTKMKGFSYPERCKSIIIRKLICNYVKTNSKDKNIKELIQKHDDSLVKYIDKNSISNAAIKGI